MSLLDIGLRNLPNVYVDKVFLEKRDDYLPKMRISLVMKDAIINGRPYWSREFRVVDHAHVVVEIEDKNGNIYASERYPLNSCLSKISAQKEGSNNMVYLFTIEKTIDPMMSYYADQSLIIKTYTEKIDPDNTAYRSQVMREAVQNSDGTIPQESFYFTLANGELYSGPFHYHEPTETFMLGENHINQSHPALTINYTRNNSISSNSLNKSISFKNTNIKTYSYNPHEMITSYVTKNNDRSIGNLFVIDLYKSLMQVDETAQIIFELNRTLFQEIAKRVQISEMNIGRVEVEEERYDNILYTEVLKSTEKGIEKHLMRVNNIKERRYTHTDCELDVYFDSNVLYALITDKDIANQRDGRYKYVTDMRIEPIAMTLVNDRMTELYRIISYYEVFLANLESNVTYDKSYNKLTPKYVRNIFASYTNFSLDDNGFYIFNRKPEFHEHIDAVIDGISLLKEMPVEELEEVETELNQMINPINTNKQKIMSFIETCRDLVSTISNTYKVNRATKNRTNLNHSKRLNISFRNNTQFDYNNADKSFNVFKTLAKPIVSPSSLKKRFNIEKSRYFEGSLGDTSFTTLPTDMRSAFVSDRESSFRFLSPLSLQTSKQDIDLQNFDFFDAVVESIYETPKTSIEKKKQSNLTLISEKSSYLDAAKILSEASDFVINKIERKRNVFNTVDPMVLNYTFALNDIVDADGDKFDLSKQQNLLLSYTKNIREQDRIASIRELPFQTKSLFYSENIRNPLNRVKATNNFKVKRLIKSIAFTTYRVEYLLGYDTGTDSFRSVHRPLWGNMQNPDNLTAESKYLLLKMTPNDKFGFKGTKEFIDNQNFVLMRNDKYMGSLDQPKRTYDAVYSPQDFSTLAYNTLNVLDDDIIYTADVSSANSTTSSWNQKRYDLFTSVRNSKTQNNRTRKAVNARRLQAQTNTTSAPTPSAPTPATTPAPTGTSGGSSGGGY